MNDLNLGNNLSTVNAGIGSALAGSTAGNSAANLDQSDFIQLLVAQVKNQDPSKPMDPSQFMSQLAQFSTVNGVKDLNTSFNSLAGKLTSEQALQATSLVGRNVLVKGDTALLQNGGNVHGEVELDQPAAAIRLKVIDAQGVEVRELPLGSAGEGRLQFNWDGFENDGSGATPGQYRLVAEGLVNGENQSLPIAVEKRVNSVTLGQDGQATRLNLNNGEIISLDDVQAIR